MSGTMLERSLHMVAMRLQKLRMLRSQALCWVLLLLPAIAACLWLPSSTGIFRTEFVVVLTATLVGILLSRATVAQPTALEAARLIEKNNPELNDAVLTAVRVNESFEQRSTVMAEMVTRHADRLARQANWSGVVPFRQMLTWSVVSFLSFVCMVSAVVAASRWGRHNGPLPAVAAAASTMSAEEEQKVLLAGLMIEPGDVEIERGTALTVVARFADGIPLRAALEFKTVDGEQRLMAMSETVDAGVFAARMEEITEDGTYLVRFDPVAKKDATADQPLSAASAEFRVTTYERPKLEQADALITPPAYTHKEPQLIEDTLRVVAVEGSAVLIQLRLNKPVALAELRNKDGAATLLTPDADDPRLVETAVVAIETQTWSIYLEDEQGRTAADEILFSLRVTRNDRPNIKVTFPGRDTDVSPLQEFLVEAQAADDFGLVDFGIEYGIAGQTQQSVSLRADYESIQNQRDDQSVNAPADGSAAGDDQVVTLPDKSQAAADHASVDAGVADPKSGVADPKSVKVSHTINLEALDAEPDSLVTYYFYADDIASDGTTRRTFSDMMFADVRRFEEIFREGQQQDQQQQQQQQQQGQQSPVDGVLQVQKEIISASWNLLRRESEVRRAGTWTKDVEVVAQSQAANIEQLEQALEQTGDDPKVAALAEEVRGYMQDAVAVLEQVRDENDGVGMSATLLPEQSAYQSLLKLRASETEVRQQQQQQGGGGGGGGQQSRQQQLKQLELDNERNRYESERQAQQQQEQSSQQREQLQILNRLKELARRQQMLNERLKQLESELRAASTEEEREEIERELKRLREEQREMLRDVDEVRERMDQATDQAQQAQSAEVREQVEQARENVQRASEAMDQGKLSEAIAEGTRAEREFEQARDQFRDQTSSQFTDAMRDLREQARELSEQQERLAEQLAGQSGDSSGREQDGREQDRIEQGGTEKEAARQRPSLRTDRNREQLEQQVRQQRDRLSQIVEESKQIIEQAEQTEPLLSTRLYDTLRDMRERKPEEALEAAEFLTSRGMWQQSQQAEQVARQGIDQLRKGIEKAADAVLGSEAEAMRRAQEELGDLSEQLSQELQSATGDLNQEQSGQRQSGGSDEYAPASEQQPNGQQQGQQAGGRQQEAGQPESSTTGASEAQRPERRNGQAGSQAQREQQPATDQSSPPGQLPGSANSNQPDSASEQAQSGDGEASAQPQPRRPGQGRGEQEQSERQGQPGEPQPGEPQPGEGQQQGSPQSSEGQQQGQQSGQPGEPQPGEGQSGEGQSGEGQPGEGQPGEGQPGEGQSGEGQSREGQQAGGGQNGQRQRSSLMDGGRQEGLGGGGNNQIAQPLTGQAFGEWSDRLREVEEMLDDPVLRNRVAQVRDRARAIRAEFKRHGTEPQWDLVKSQLLGEMQTLQKRIAEELARMDSDRSMVPIDREPVPEEFDGLVQRYYELLGQQRREGNKE